MGGGWWRASLPEGLVGEAGTGMMGRRGVHGMGEGQWAALHPTSYQDRIYELSEGYFGLPSILIPFETQIGKRVISPFVQLLLRIIILSIF